MSEPETTNDLDKSVWEAVGSLFKKLYASTDQQEARIAAIEDRLSKLDDGPDSERAKSNALNSVNEASRRGNGQHA